MCYIFITNNENSILKCKYTHKKKSSDLIPGYVVKPTRFSQDPNKVIFNFFSYVLTEDENVYFVKGLGFVYHLKRLSMLTFLHNLNCYINTIKCLK